LRRSTTWVVADGAIRGAGPAGLQGVLSATFATPSVAPLTADFGPFAVLHQGQNTPQPRTPLAPAFPDAEWHSLRPRRTVEVGGVFRKGQGLGGRGRGRPRGGLRGSRGSSCTKGFLRRLDPTLCDGRSPIRCAQRSPEGLNLSLVLMRLMGAGLGDPGRW
jgi:hypothetical protein